MQPCVAIYSISYKVHREQNKAHFVIAVQYAAELFIRLNFITVLIIETTAKTVSLLNENNGIRHLCSLGMLRITLNQTELCDTENGRKRQHSKHLKSNPKIFGEVPPYDFIQHSKQ
jgi:hypothetical protein